MKTFLGYNTNDLERTMQLTKAADLFFNFTLEQLDDGKRDFKLYAGRDLFDYIIGDRTNIHFFISHGLSLKLDPYKKGLEFGLTHTKDLLTDEEFYGNNI